MKLCIKVTPETSGLVQELLFSYGYKWPFGGRQISFTHQTYLITNDEFFYITHCSDNNGKYRELTFKELLEYLKTGKVPEIVKTFTDNDISIEIRENNTTIIKRAEPEDIVIVVPNKMISKIATELE